jgi:hypothetical protein
MPRLVTARLTRDQLALLVEALDSHIYWQLSDEHYRNSGFVYGKGSDDPRSRREIRTSERLLSRLEALAQRECQRETTR